MDGRQVDERAQAGPMPPAQSDGPANGEASSPSWSAAFAGWPFNDALARLVPPASAWLVSGAALRQRLGLLFSDPRPWARRAGPHLRLVLRGAAWLSVALAVAVLALAVLYRWVNPPLSTLMLGQSLTGTEIERRWVPLERISPHLVKAVIVSEDGAFCLHGGVDWHAIRDAMGDGRGGSTITMQVVKNLFLWPSRSYVRKAIEIGLAYLVDALWPKRRIIEIYLNIAEWGDGVFGAEAAARANFAKPAAALRPDEAALMAVALPSPLERTPGLPSAGMHRLADRLLVRMMAARVGLSCVRSRRQHEARPVAQRPAPKPQKGPAKGPQEGPAQKGAWEYLFPDGN